MTDLPHLDETRLAKLAREMAMNIRPVANVFADFGIDESDYYEITKNPFYKKALEHFLIEWNATISTADRVKFQGQAGFEQLLPILIKRAMDPREPLAAASEIGKLAAKVGGIGEGSKGEATAAERFIITINLGADVDGKPVVEKYDKAITIDADAGSGAVATGYRPPDPSPDPSPEASLTVPAKVESSYEAALKSLMEKG